MYQTTSVFVEAGDAVAAETSQPGYVSVRVTPVQGGSFSLIYPASASDAGSIAAIDMLVAALQEARAELTKRLSPLPIVQDQEGRTLIGVGHEAWRIAHGSQPSQSAAGDPDGEGPDFPAADDDSEAQTRRIR